MRKARQLKFAIDFFENCQLLQPNEVEVSPNVNNSAVLFDHKFEKVKGLEDQLKYFSVTKISCT